MTNEVLQAIEARRSCRSYEERQILPEELSAVTRAGTWAPTGMGRQAVKIVVVQDKDTVAKLERMNAAVLGNPDAHPFYGAPTVLVVFADSTVPTHVPDGSLVLGTTLVSPGDSIPAQSMKPFASSTSPIRNSFPSSCARSPAKDVMT